MNPILKHIVPILFLALILWLLSPYIATGQENNKCYDSSWEVSVYSHKTRGEVVLYLVPIGYKITPTNLACISVLEVIKRRKNMPNKLTVGLISKDYTEAFLIKWDLKNNRFILIETHTTTKYSTEGKFVVYPNPLKRLKEVLLVKRFPTPDQLPAHLRKKFKTNILTSTSSQLKALFNR